jgi:hypothetical protein
MIIMPPPKIARGINQISGEQKFVIKLDDKVDKLVKKYNKPKTSKKSPTKKSPKK